MGLVEVDTGRLPTSLKSMNHYLATYAVLRMQCAASLTKFQKSARPGSGNAAAVSRSEILRLTGRNLASSAAPAAVIGASEIDRMKVGVNDIMSGTNINLTDRRLALSRQRQTSLTIESGPGQFKTPRMRKPAGERYSRFHAVTFRLF